MDQQLNRFVYGNYRLRLPASSPIPARLVHAGGVKATPAGMADRGFRRYCHGSGWWEGLGMNRGGFLGNEFPENYAGLTELKVQGETASRGRKFSATGGAEWPPKRLLSGRQNFQPREIPIKNGASEGI